MRTTTVLHHYCPNKRPNDQLATWAGLQLIRMNPRWLVVDRTCDGPYSWADALEELWDVDGDLVTVDQDIAIHPEHLHDFEECPQQACVYAYYINDAIEPERKLVVAHRYLDSSEYHWVDVGQSHCQWPAMGLMRIRQGARQSLYQTPRVPRVDFHDQEYYLAQRMNTQWHIHWPAVAHHHVWA